MAKQFPKLLLVVISAILLAVLGSVNGRYTALPVQAQEEEVGNIDVVLILDTSGSMTNNDPEALRVPAAKLFIDLASAGDKFGVVTMAGGADTRTLTPEMVSITNNASREALKTTIEQASASRGRTYMGDALNIAYDLLANAPANEQRFVLLLSDGVPDPLSQQEIALGAVNRFQAQFVWPIFAVALGNEADINFLEADITTPTGGQAFAATNAGELVDLYLRIFELLLDDRYIEQVSVPPNEELPFISLVEDHRLTQLSFVVHRSGGAPTAVSLKAPDGTELVGKNLVEVYYSEDNTYEVYTVFANETVSLAGDWTIALTGTADPSLVTIMSRSELRVRLTAPRAIYPPDERALRFLPAERPFYLRLGALDDSGLWALGMEPALEIPAGSGNWVSIQDDGQLWDFTAGDGQYTFVEDSPLAPGDYTLRLEVPFMNERPVHLYKTYPVTVMALPSLSIKLLNVEEEFGLGDTLSGEVFLQPLRNLPVEGLSSIAIAVRDPSGVVTLLEPLPMEGLQVPSPDAAVTAVPSPTPTVTPPSSVPLPSLPDISVPNLGLGDKLEGSLFQFAYAPPSGDGVYTFMAVADLYVVNGDIPIPFTEFAQTTFAFNLPSVTLSTTIDGVAQAAGFKTEVTVDATSNTQRDETLTVSAVGRGLDELVISPTEINILANQETSSYTFDVFTKNEPGTQGELELQFASPANTILVNEPTHSWTIQVSSGLQITTVQTETEIITREGGEITVEVASESPLPEEVSVSLVSSEGLGVTDVIPGRIIVPPGETTPFTFKVYSDQEPGAAGEVTLTFTTTSQDVAVANDAHTWQATVRSGGLGSAIFLFFSVVLVIGFVAFMIVRRRRRQSA